jgi:caa(3)-type oxidase subunit IV
MADTHAAAAPGSHGVHAETHGGGIPNVLLVTALLIMSAIKFALVVGFFMHLKYDHNIMRSFFIGPLFIAICIILALMALFSAFILLPRPH